MDSSLAVVVTDLSKSFPTGFLGRRRRPALSDLSLSIRNNEIFGYLGPNGAGKTTTLKILMGLIRPDRGSATILGHPLESSAWRYRAGFLPENPYFYDYLTAEEYLHFVGRLHGLPTPLRRERIGTLLERVGLTRSRRLPLRRFSKGMTQRVGIAQALIADPDIVFLDEPMSGLDPIGRHLVRNIILELKERGKTVFFSTHILSDAETLCDRVALLRGGELLKAGRLDEILSMEVAHMEVLVGGLDAAAIEQVPCVLSRRSIGERWRLEVAERGVGAVVQAVETAGGRLLSVQPVRESLEEYFFRELGSHGAGGTWED